MSTSEIQSTSQAALQEFRGVPNEPRNEGERGLWRRFLEAALPWLGQKWGLAERLAEAKVRQEMAQARILEAQATQEALKAVDMARTMEAEKMVKLTEVVGDARLLVRDDTELRDAVEEIQKKIDALSWRYGTRIEFHQTSTASTPPSSVRLEKPAGGPTPPAD